MTSVTDNQNELLDELNAYKLIIQNSFQIDMNCNDFFAYNTAWSLSIDEEDFEWIVPFVVKHKQAGIDAVCAYIENMQPLKPLITKEFETAIQELIDRNQKVYSDEFLWDKKKVGPYRNSE